MLVEREREGGLGSLLFPSLRPRRKKRKLENKGGGHAPRHQAGLKAQQHLRSILSFCNSPQINSPDAYIQFTRGLITDEGEVTNAETAEFLRSYMAVLLGFIERVYTVLPRPGGG